MSRPSIEGGRFLVTGGAGFIGSSLADRLLANGAAEVVILDNLLTGKREFVPEDSRCRFIKGDICDAADVATAFEGRSYDAVFHYAAVVGVDRTLKRPLLVLDDVPGTRIVLEASANSGVGRFMYASSSEVYGEPVEMPQHEERTPLNARLPYAVVKAAGEMLCRAYGEERGLDWTALRFFNTYGPRQSEDFVVSRFMRAALAGEPLTVYGDGSQTRTFCYIDDNLDATLAVLEEADCAGQAINIGSDVLVSVLDLAKTVLEVTGSRSEIVFAPPRQEGDVSRRQPNLERMQALPRDAAPIALRAGLAMIAGQTASTGSVVSASG